MSDPQRTLFIVEDTKDWSKQVAGLIKDRFPDAQISIATSLAEARQALDTTPFQMAVVDVRLDDSNEANKDGLAVADLIRKRHPSTIIFFLTGYATLELVEQAMRPNADGYSLADDFIEKSDVPKLVQFLDQLWGRKG